MDKTVFAMAQEPYRLQAWLYRFLQECDKMAIFQAVIDFQPSNRQPK